MKALITGILGQDGSYLAEFLNKKGYEVHGMVRRTSSPHDNLDVVEPIATLHTGDMTDTQSIRRILKEVSPDEIYNLAAQSHVGDSFKAVESTIDINFNGVIRLLEAVRDICPNSRVYQASTSEMFGEVAETPQNEETPLNARSPYGLSKIASHYACRYYRENYGMHISCGILFNHESPRRPETFVTRKITMGVASGGELKMGSLHPKRDWGYAPEYVEAMWLMLQQDNPDDYVIATGETHTVEEFLEAGYKHAGKDWHQYYVEDERYIRPAEVNLLVGDPSKAERVLGWKAKIKFEKLVGLMVDADVDREDSESLRDW